MLTFLFLIFAGIGITNLVVNSSLLDPIRNFIIDRSEILGKLVSCMMCSGFWVGILLSLGLDIPFWVAGPVVSLFSYIFGMLVEYLDIVKAVQASQIKDEESEE